MDERLRALERRWGAAPADRDAGLAVIRSRLRVGESLFQIRALLSGHFTLAGLSEFGMTEYIHIQTGMRMVEIPAGEYLMGGSIEGAVPEEQPQHRVVIHRPFLISKTDVTQAQWKQAMDGANPSNFQGTSESPVSDEGLVLDQWGNPYDSHPVDSVSWSDCQEFCARTGMRLPTEALWEFACRAGTMTRYYSGDSIEDLLKVAWFGQEWSDGHRAVGLLKPNAWGLFDMLGNIFNWNQDRWHHTYEGAPENGFVAWDDDTGYNHSMWLEGELQELILQGVGAKTPEEVFAEAEDEEEVRRQTAYGLSVRLAPRKRKPRSAVATRSAALAAHHTVVEDPEIPAELAGVVPGRSGEVDKASIIQPFGQGQVREVQAADPPRGGVPPAFGGTSPETYLWTPPNSESSDSDTPELTRSSETSDGRAGAQSTGEDGDSEERSGSIKTGTTWDSDPFGDEIPTELEDDVPLEMPVVSQADIDHNIKTEHTSGRETIDLRVRRGDFDWGPLRSQLNPVYVPRRSNNERRTKTRDQSFRVVWA